MSNNTGNAASGHDQGDASLWEAIQTFETILEVFPEDVNALESLVDSYEQTNDIPKFRDKALKLIRLMTKEGDWHRVAALAERLLKHLPHDADALAQLEAARLNLGETEAGSPILTSSQAALTCDLRGELELAWHLLQSEVISQMQYEKAIETLTQASMGQSDSPVSLLCELREVDRVDMEKVVAFLAAESGMPYVDLSLCDCDEATAARLPVLQAKKLGVLPFSKVGSDITVAVLNPVDKELRGRLKTYFKTNVHFYFTSPDEFLGTIAKLQEKAKAQK